jgi:hypothetical protein
LLDLKTVKTIFGIRHRSRRRRQARRNEVVIERPSYDLTVFKVHFGKLTLKVHTKGERVLRIEAIVHNTAELRCGKLLERFPRIVDTLAELLERFLQTVRGIEAPFVADNTLDELAAPGHLGTARIGGIDLNRPRLRALLAAVVALSASAEPFTSSGLAVRVGEAVRLPYSARQAAYDLRQLRAKALVVRVPRRVGYRATPDGLRIMAALLVLRDKVIRPILAGVLHPRPGRPRKRSALEEHYHRLQQAMGSLLAELGIAA